MDLLEGSRIWKLIREDINMSGIVGSKFNSKGSGPVGSLGTDGQVFTSSGAGKSATYEAGAGFGVGDITGATALAEEPALDDELILSDAGTLKRLDLKHMMGVPFIALRTGTATVFSSSVETVQPWTITDKSIEGTWDGTNHRWTPGVAGFYWSLQNWRFPAIANGKLCACQIIVNTGYVHEGNNLYSRGDSGGGWDGGYQYARSSDNTLDPRMTTFFYMDDNDYVTSRFSHNAGSNKSSEPGYSGWFMWKHTGCGESSNYWSNELGSQTGQGQYPPSDLRLKNDIEKVGKSPSGINIYQFGIGLKDFEGRYEGVMAHEVPWAREKTRSGYYAVDYSKIDVDFKKLKKELI
jgi:hypothetical protein